MRADGVVVGRSLLLICLAACVRPALDSDPPAGDRGPAMGYSRSYSFCHQECRGWDDGFVSLMFSCPTLCSCVTRGLVGNYPDERFSDYVREQEEGEKSEDPYLSALLRNCMDEVAYLPTKDVDLVDQSWYATHLEIAREDRRLPRPGPAYRLVFTEPLVVVWADEPTRRYTAKQLSFEEIDDSGASGRAEEYASKQVYDQLRKEWRRDPSKEHRGRLSREWFLEARRLLEQAGFWALEPERPEDHPAGTVVGRKWLLEVVEAEKHHAVERHHGDPTGALGELMETLLVLAGELPDPEREIVEAERRLHLKVDVESLYDAASVVLVGRATGLGPNYRTIEIQEYLKGPARQPSYAHGLIVVSESESSECPQDADRRLFSGAWVVVFLEVESDPNLEQIRRPPPGYDPRLFLLADPCLGVLELTTRIESELQFLREVE